MSTTNAIRLRRLLFICVLQTILVTLLWLGSAYASPTKSLTANGDEIKLRGMAPVTQSAPTLLPGPTPEPAVAPVTMPQPALATTNDLFPQPQAAYAVIPVIHPYSGRRMFGDVSQLIAHQMTKALRQQALNNGQNVRFLDATELSMMSKNQGISGTYQALVNDYILLGQPQPQNWQLFTEKLAPYGVSLSGLLYVSTEVDMTHPFEHKEWDWSLRRMFDYSPRTAQNKLVMQTELFQLENDAVSVWQGEATKWIDWDDMVGVSSSVYDQQQNFSIFNGLSQKMTASVLATLPPMALNGQRQNSTIPQLSVTSRIITDNKLTFKRYLKGFGSIFKSQVINPIKAQFGGGNTASTTRPTGNVLLLHSADNP